MATFKLPVKKKKTKKDEIFCPLPVPTCSLIPNQSSKSNWCYYHGVFADDYVLVEITGDVHDLSCQGFFGKIILKNKFSENDMSIIDSINIQSDEASLSDEVFQIRDSTNDFKTKSLHLSFCESFFLSYALGCLFVKKDNNLLSISQQWSLFCSKLPYFPIMYAAYHYFRSKGWVPKEGIRYGSDFLLYRKGPPYYHASYITVVQCICAETLKPLNYNGVEERTFSWESLSSLLRLATSVSKEVMFCYVALPKYLAANGDIKIDDIKNFQIFENIVSRWVSSKEREKEMLDVDCDF